MPPPPPPPHETTFETIKKIYDSLSDDQSRMLFFDLLQYRITGDFASIYATLIQTVKSNKFIALLRNNIKMNKDRIVLYGSRYFHHAEIFSKIADKLGIAIFAICYGSTENHPCINNLQIITEEDLFNKYTDSKIVFFSLDAWKERSYFVNKCWNLDNLFILLEELSTQYFDEDIMTPHEHEVFVDGGACDMKTSIDFAKWCNGQYDAIHAFEPDPVCIEKCKDTLENTQLLSKHKCHVYHAGLWSNITQFQMRTDGTGGASLAEDGQDTVNVTNLDVVLGQNNPVTFIKLDIEGSEFEALKGAKTIIQKWRPRLAVCIYHKPEDIIELPNYILSLVPDYKLYIRQYQAFIFETVLYCL
jgi:FkbM family methyltransferase